MVEAQSPRELVDRLLWILCKHWVLVATLFSVTLIAVVGGVVLLDPEYRATAKILVRHNPRQQLILFNDLESPGPVSLRIDPVKNLVELATSRGIAEAVARRLGLDQPKMPVGTRGHIKYWTKAILKSPITLCQAIGLISKKPDPYLAEAIDTLIKDAQSIEVRGLVIVTAAAGEVGVTAIVDEDEEDVRPASPATGRGAAAERQPGRPCRGPSQ